MMDQDWATRRLEQRLRKIRGEPETSPKDSKPPPELTATPKPQSTVTIEKKE